METQTPTHFSYAGFWSRVAAALIDLTVLFGPFFVLIAIFASLDSVAQSQGFEGPLMTVLQVVMFLLSAGAMLALLSSPLWYYARQVSGPQQATYGKQVMKLYVADEAGQRLSFGMALGRWAVEYLALNIISFIVYVTIPFTERKQSIHDILMRTVVLKRV